jgi:hypothetical protein
MAEEQTPQGVQDPVQSQGEQVAPPTPPEPVQQAAPVGQAPWSQSLQQAFTPEQAAAVDAWARANVQPYVTRLEQQYAETEAARQLLGAFETDADAANVAVQRQLYGDAYGDQFAAAIGRTDLVVNQAPAQPQYQPQQAAQPQQPAVDPKYDEMYQEWNAQRQEQQYEEAKATFLQDPQYRDINPELFDGFVAGAETWEDAVNAYRAFAAQFAQSAEPAAQPETAPPVMGSGTVGGNGSTPTYPRETLSEAIDGIFSENKPLAPPVIGS